MVENKEFNIGDELTPIAIFIGIPFTICYFFIEIGVKKEFIPFIAIIIILLQVIYLQYRHKKKKKNGR